MMQVPVRLLDDHGCDPSVRALLAEAGQETGPALAKAKTLAALGLVGASVGVAGSASAATAGVSGGATSAGTAGAATASSIAISMKVALGVVVAGVVASSAALVMKAPPSSMPPPSPVATVAAPRTNPVAPSTMAITPLPAPSVPVANVEALPETLPPSPVATTTTTTSEAPRTARSAATPSSARSVAAPAPKTTPHEALLEEAAVLERARGDLTNGRAASALAALDGYDQRFPRGELRPEATALRVEALAASGNTSAARALGSAFLATHPRHPAAVRVRRALGEASP